MGDLPFGMGMEAKNTYRVFLIVAGMVVAMVAYALEGQAQSQQFIYARVHTDRTIYTGPIRWGGEEVLWTDLFNAAKRNNDYTRLVPEEKNDKDWWENYNWTFSSIWENKGTSHQFTCQFGNIKELTPRGSNRAVLKLKNGGELEVDGTGYNDIGAKVQVLDEELGVLSINWDRIIKVEFLPTPAKLEQAFGIPLYGTVEGGRREKFTGFIVWDNDERLATDKLDGDTRDGDVSFKFSEIVSIEKEGDGCQVTLKSGRTLFIDDSNDVNSGNRGVLVVDPAVGVIEFSWDAFRKVTFSTPPANGMRFDDFPSPRPMMATVSLLEGADITGRVIYDVDEALDFEIVEGKENDIEYQIPIRNIKRITPKNFDYSQIELRNGQILLLGGMRDVSEDNSGLLVFQKGKKDPAHVGWRKINEIVFQ